MSSTESSQREQLVSYIKAIKDLETLKYMQNKARNALQYNINDCNNIISTRDQASVAPKAKQKSSFFNPVEFFGYFSIFFIIVLFFGICFACAEVGNIFFIFYSRAWKIVFKTLIVGLVVGIIAGLIDNYMRWKSDCKYEEKKYQENVAEANAKNQTIAKQNTSLEKRRQVARRQLSVYSEQLRKVNTDHAKINALLQSYYGCNVIHPKYHNNLVYICQIYEYFDTRRCDTLTGPHGAYNLLEADIKYGDVVDKLDVISKKLDQVINNQREIVDAIDRCNSSVRNLGRSLDALSSTVSNTGADIRRGIDSLNYNVQNAAEYQRLSAELSMYRFLRSETL